MVPVGGTVMRNLGNVHSRKWSRSFSKMDALIFENERALLSQIFNHTQIIFHFSRKILSSKFPPVPLPHTYFILIQRHISCSQFDIGEPKQKKISVLDGSLTTQLFLSFVLVLSLKNHCIICQELA